MDPYAGHEAAIAVSYAALPNSSLGAGASGASSREKTGSEYFYKYATPHAWNSTLQRYSALPITAGTYYVAVISQGQNPASSSRIGTGTVDYTLTSHGTVTVADKTASVLSTTSAVQWQGETALYGQQKVYRFHVPAGLSAIEVRLNNRVGAPNMALYRNAPNDVLIPYLNGTYISSDGGGSADWINASLITVANPVAGDYTLKVVNDQLGLNTWPYTTTYPDAGYDIQVSALTPRLLNYQNDNYSGSLVDGKKAFYQVIVPANTSGMSVDLYTSNGSAAVRLRKDLLPDGSNNGDTVSSSRAESIWTSGYLTPGIWYIEVTATGLTDYTLAVKPIVSLRTWTMPADGYNAAQAGLTHPLFGDSGVDNLGNPIINANVGGQGTDLAQDHYHFYKVIVPDGNAGLLRTQLDAISGDPDIYLRVGNPPSREHRAEPYTYNNSWSGTAYDRSQTLAGTQYGNWVPLDNRVEPQLTPGVWWIAVFAKNSNVRYRLHVSVGDVQPLAQNGGSVASQLLAAGDMRYYKVQIPQSSPLVAGSTPIDWYVTLMQQIGDVAIFVRDTTPSGQGANGLWYTSSFTSGTGYFQDWYDDNSYLSSQPYQIYDLPGVHTLSLPPVKPGHTYYLGVFAKTDASFDLASSVGATTLALNGVIDF
ncbi:MAG: hypothetical protein R8J85_07605, partial [Mariprofundales bacterium]